MVKPATNSLVNVAGYKFYSPHTLNRENLQKCSIAKRCLISLTKDSGTMVGTLGAGATFISIIHSLLNRDTSDSSFLGVLKRWGVPIFSTALSIFGLVLSSKYDESVIEESKAAKNQLGKITATILSGLKEQVQRANVDDFVRNEIFQAGKKLSNDLSEQEITDGFLNLSGLQHFKTNEGEYLQTATGGDIDITVSEKAEGTDKIFGFRFLINKGKDLKDTFTKKSGLRLVSKNAGEPDNSFAVEPSFKKEATLLGLIGIQEQTVLLENKDVKDTDDKEAKERLIVKFRPKEIAR